MENSIVTLGVYFEIRDSIMYGGEGTIGYANINLDLEISSLEGANVCEYIENQRDGIAKMCKVEVDKVHVISRTEYEDNAE